MQKCLGYTQVIWSSTRTVGCGKLLCDGHVYVSCLFGASGNVGGHQPYVPGSHAVSTCQWPQKDEQNESEAFWLVAVWWRIPAFLGGILVVGAGAAIYFMDGETCDGCCESKRKDMRREDKYNDHSNIGATYVPVSDMNIGANMI